eukprot:5723381-Ditylum_brightwellii.AAC.1
MEGIPHLDDGKGYKYLGILKSSDFLMQKVKDNTIKEYYAQVRKVCKAQLLGHNTMMAICNFVVSVI